MSDINLPALSIRILDNKNARLFIEDFGMTTYGVGYSSAESIGLAILAAAEWFNNEAVES